MLGLVPVSMKSLEEYRPVVGDAVIEELRESRVSERAGRLIDKDQDASMERKKREGYF